MSIGALQENESTFTENPNTVQFIGRVTYIELVTRSQAPSGEIDHCIN